MPHKVGIKNITNRGITIDGHGILRPNKVTVILVRTLDELDKYEGKIEKWIISGFGHDSTPSVRKAKQVQDLSKKSDQAPQKTPDEESVSEPEVVTEKDQEDVSPATASESVESKKEEEEDAGEESGVTKDNPEQEVKAEDATKKTKKKRKTKASK